jgi:quinol monooxygenase YgiN
MQPSTGRTARMPMIRVVAVITAHPGRRDEILAAFRANVPNVHAEKGCIEYAGHIDAVDIGPFQTAYGQDTFVVLESWESADALRAHAAAPHMKAYGEKTKDLIAKRTIHVLSAID